MADKYWSSIAQATGMQYCPKQGPFGQSDGAVIGVRNGYIMAIGPAKDGNQSSVKIMLRFSPVSDVSLLRMALSNSNALAVALDTDTVKDKQLKAATLANESLVWRWNYSLGKPKAEKVAALANALADALKGTAPDLQSKCEECKNATVQELLLMNNVPVFYCGTCQFRMQEKMNEAARGYEAMESNLGLGLMYGCAAALAGALAWGGIAFAINRIFLWGGVIIGGFVAWAVIKGMGRINLMGQVAIFALTVASVLGGDFLYYTFYTMRDLQVPFSTELMSKIASVFWQVEMKEGVLSIIVAVAGAGYTVYARARQPKFAVQFTSLQPEGQAKSAGM